MRVFVSLLVNVLVAAAWLAAGFVVGRLSDWGRPHRCPVEAIQAMQRKQEEPLLMLVEPKLAEVEDVEVLRAVLKGYGIPINVRIEVCDYMRYRLCEAYSDGRRTMGRTWEATLQEEAKRREEVPRPLSTLPGELSIRCVGG